MQKGKKVLCYFLYLRFFTSPVKVCVPGPTWRPVLAVPLQFSSTPGAAPAHTPIGCYLTGCCCLLAQRASCGPLAVSAGGRGCQFRRDALGAPLPPRARQPGAEPAALHVRNTLLVRQRHLQGGGSLPGAQRNSRKKTNE